VADEPRLDRPVTLALRGDWGQANMHRICGWLAQEIGDRSPHGSQFAIWSGRGGTDQIAALRSGAADIAVVTPAAAVSLLQPGDLCALGVIGQRDRLVVAVDAALPATTVADLASVPGGLTVATSPDDGVNLIGLAVHKALRLAGLDTAALSFRYDERPFPAIGWFADGEADVLIHEAIMTPHWQRIAAKRPVRYLPWGDDVLAAFAAGSVISVLLVIFSSGAPALTGIVLLGFFHSIMFPTIFALSIRHLGPYTKRGSSFVVMAILGGAVFPALMGRISDASNIQRAFFVPLACYLFVLYFATRGYRVKHAA